MAISLVGTNVAVAAAAADVTINLPAGVQQNDVAYVMVASTSTADQNVTETGGTWQELADLYSNDNLDVNMGVYRKVMGAVPDTSVTMDAAGISANHVALIYVLRGVDTTTPEDATTTTATGIDGPAADCPSITTVTANAWVLAFGGSSEADTVTNAPSGYGNLITQTSTNICAVGSTKLVATPAPENPAAYSDLVGDLADSWCAVTVAVRPAASAQPPRSMHQSRMRRAA